VGKKIVIVGPSYPFRGGIAANNDRLAREFMNTGSDVVIFTFSLQYPSFLFPGKTQFSNEPKPKELDIRIEVNSINPISWFKVGRKIKNMRPDILLIRYWLPFMGPCFGTIARIAKKNKHTKVISVLDNYIPHEKRIGDKCLSKYFIKPVDGCVVMSHSVKTDLEKATTNKPIDYCPHPLFDHFGEILPKKEAQKIIGIDENCRWMLFFGLIRDYKGLDLLLKAMVETPASAPDLKLMVAGEFYSNADVYYKMVKDLGLKERVVFFPEFIPDNKVPLFFSAADIVVQPYKNATQSGVTQIAYHFNKPMIVTNVGGLAEIIPNEKVGFVVNIEPSAIANAINRFYSENREKEFTEGAAIEKTKYSWKRMAETIHLIYSKLTGLKENIE
jgi:D-inositol-3-phosphate glycosyltransferase